MTRLNTQTKGSFLPTFGTEGSIGNTYYVTNLSGAGGSNGNSGLSPSDPWQTLTYAETQVSAYDTIIVLPGHNETVTAEIAFDTNYVRIKGVKSGSQRPILTPNLAGNCVSLDGIGVVIEGIEFAVPGTDSQDADIDMVGVGTAVIDCVFHGSTTDLNKDAIITVTATATGALIKGNRIYNEVVDVPIGISIEGAVDRCEVCDNAVMSASATIGYSSGAITDSAIATNLYVHHNLFSNTKAATAVVELGQSYGAMCFNHVAGRHTTIASNCVTTTMNVFENRVVEEANLNGGIIPAADAE